MKSLLRVLIMCSCCVAVGACDDYHYRFFGAVDRNPVSPQPVVASPFGTWRADAMIVSVTAGRTCNMVAVPGQTTAGVPWRITVGPGSILFEQNTAGSVTNETSFSGALNGQEFTASTSTSANPLQSTCLFRGGTLLGRFSADFTTFDATEELTWGQPGSEMVVQRHWVGARTSN